MRYLADARRSTPRRRSELGLLVVGGVVVLYASLLASLALTQQLPDHAIEFIIGMVVVAGAVQIGNRRLVPDADPVMMPVALLLSGLGYVMIGRLDPGAAGKQLAWTVLGVLVYLVVLAAIQRSRDLERYRYLLLVLAFVLLVSPLAPVIGRNINGARLWVGLGGPNSPLQFQPVEIAKLLLVVFFASYFIEKRELLTIPTQRVGEHLLPDLRAFGPIAVAGAMSLLIILAEHDIGFSLLLFVVFLGLVWLTTGRWTYVIVGLVVFVLATFLAADILGQVNSRFTIWLDPWKYYGHTCPYCGFQPVQGELAIGRGGWFGSGIGLGIGGAPTANAPWLIPFATSDFIFAVIGEELGLVGTAAVVLAYVLLIGAGLRTAIRAHSEFSKLLAAGLTMVLGFQTFFIMAGVVRLLPLTGVTLPFVSYGGSSLVANFALLALLMRISQEANQAGGSNPASSSTAGAAVMGAGRR